MDRNDCAVDLARLLEELYGARPTRERIEAKWATLSEDWHRLLRVCPTLCALLRQWARTDRTLRAVATCYGEAMRKSVDKLLDFSPDMVATFRALWPSWRDPSPNCLGGELDDYFEALRFCGQVRGLYQIAFDMRKRREARRP